MQPVQVEARTPGLEALQARDGGRVVTLRSPDELPARPGLQPKRERTNWLAHVRTLQQKMRRRALFLTLVALPTLLTSIYMFFIASDQYISEAHFIVKSANRQNVSGIGALLQSTGLSGIRDESFSVTDFLKSRDALREISEAVSFRDMVSREGADFLARFPAFYHDGSFEELYEHYSQIVTVIHDPTTGINTLKVRLFSADDSKRLAEALLQSSERLVNRLNDRALGDAVALARKEVEKAEQRSAAAQEALTKHRISSGIVDTTATAKGYLELVGGIERELAAARAQLSQMLASSPNNPGIPATRDRVRALEQQVASERNKVVGGDGALVGTFAEFARLTLEAEFAAKALVAANTMLETSRVEAMRKQLYLERVVEPNAADESRYPRRIIAVLTVFGTASLVYAVIWLVVANAREHAS